MYTLAILILIAGITTSFALQCIRVQNDPSQTIVTNITEYETCRETNDPYCCFSILKNTTRGFILSNAGCWAACDDCTDECVTRPMRPIGYHKCCCPDDNCNKNPILDLTKIPTTATTTMTFQPHPKPKSHHYSIYIVIPIMVFITAIAFAWLCTKVRKSRAEERMRQGAVATPPIVSKQMQLQEMVSRGQFGCVWKGYYEHKSVAVKVILPQVKDSWETERSIFSDYNLNHENILKFYSAEKRCEDGCIQYWIITEYHENGSLADHLRTNIFDFQALKKLILSIVNGLVYLHDKVTATKPQIAHRDLKSRNILVKTDGSCCISDFGSAWAFPVTHETEEAMAQVGTNRYMAPEVLEGAVAFHATSFLVIDVYALSLVMWECLSRCNVSSAPVGNYYAAYEEEVGARPTLEDMRRCVVEELKRPILCTEWREHNQLSVICNTCEECWDNDGEARLSAACVYERLLQLRSHSTFDIDSNDIDSNDIECTGETTLIPLVERGGNASLSYSDYSQADSSDTGFFFKLGYNHTMYILSFII